MSMLDILNQALGDIDENYHVFLLKYKGNAKIVYGFVEGKDDPMYYRGIIEHVVPADWSIRLFSAGNKEKVMQTYGAFDWNRFNKLQIAFFIDSDIDKFSGVRTVNALNIYKTDGYSMENSVVNFEVFMRVLSEVMNIVHLPDADTNLIEKSFLEDLLLFQSTLSVIMAQIIIWCRNRSKANLDNLDLRPIFNFVNGRLVVDENFKLEASRLTHLSRCVGAPLSADSEINAEKNRFESQGGPQNNTRGKYVLWFFSNILINVHKEIIHFSPSIKSPPRVKIAIGPNNALVVSAPRARCPHSLRVFLENTFLQFIGSWDAAVA